LNILFCTAYVTYVVCIFILIRSESERREKSPRQMKKLTNKYLKLM
jgi:hypothetical protein